MRPTYLHINTDALLHNLSVIQAKAPKSKVIAMVKSNAYGCGLEFVVKALDGKVASFGVACLAEALAIRSWGIQTPCLIFQGMHQAEEWQLASRMGFEVVVHHKPQLEWLLQRPLEKPVKVWIKMNTGMHRLGFPLEDFLDVAQTLRNCPWVDNSIGLMTHFACADEPHQPLNQLQKSRWTNLIENWQGPISACNSAAIWSFPECYGTHIRPGISLYGVSPFEDKTFHDLDLKPVMNYRTAVMSIQDYPKGIQIGYGATYETMEPTRVGIVAVGYGDGYPRHVVTGASVWIKDQLVPIIGRISMDMMSVNLTHCTGVQLGDAVELWGENLPIETLAKLAGTSPYELMCQVCPRERLLDLYLRGDV